MVGLLAGLFPRNIQLIPYLALTFVATHCAAQDVEVREGPDKPSPRLTLVMDVSGSMRGSKISQAIGLALEAALAPTEDLEVSVFAFDAAYRRIRNPEVEEDAENAYWFKLPDADVAKELRKQIAGLGAGGGTNPNTALRHAFSERTDMIVFITDGDFNKEATLTTLREAQERRRKAELSLDRFVIVGIQCSDEDRESLQEIARETRAIFYEVVPPPEPEPEPDPDPPVVGPQPKPQGPQPQGPKKQKKSPKKQKKP